MCCFHFILFLLGLTLDLGTASHKASLRRSPNSRKDDGTSKLFAPASASCGLCEPNKERRGAPWCKDCKPTNNWRRQSIVEDLCNWFFDVRVRDAKETKLAVISP